MSRFLRHILVTVFALASFGALSISCATSSSTSRQKPYEFCYCGAMKGPDNKNYCGIWSDRKRLDLPHAALQVKEQASCTPDDCSKLYSSSCERMQMWGYPAVEYPKPSPTPCICDASLVENDRGQTTLVCAAWMPDQKNLLEYYQTKECTPQTCGKAPFTVAPKLCPEGFKAHYLPFPKTSIPPLPVK